MAKTVADGQASDLSQMLGRAKSFHERGQLAAAEPLYLQILRSSPQHVEAGHYLGILRFQQGHANEALERRQAGERLLMAIERRQDVAAIVVRLGILRHVRETLANNRSGKPLFDTNRFHRGIEAAYRRMWETWQRGEPAQAFRVDGFWGRPR